MANPNSKGWQTVGTIKESKAKPGEHYMTIDQLIPAGTVLRLQNPRDLYDLWVEQGRMTVEEAEEKKAAIPHFVKYNLILPPPQVR